MEEEKTEKQEEMIIPEINIDEGKIILNKKDILLVVNGKEETITLQQISSGDRRELAKKYLSSKVVGQQMQGSMDAAGYQIGLLSKVIIKAPFPISEPMIASFPDKVLDYLYSQYVEFTGDPKKKLD